jgi:hypothetical protein
MICKMRGNNGIWAWSRNAKTTLFDPYRKSHTVIPDAATELQIERLRAMTGAQRLKIALDLHEFASNVSRAGIRQQFPEADEEEVERHLRRRIELSRQ